MFCGKCGAQIEDGTLFCPNCGAKITETVEAAKETAAEAVDNTVAAVEETATETANEAVNAAAEVQNTVTEAAGEIPSQPVPPVQPVQQDAGEKKGFGAFLKKNKVLVAALAILVVILVVVGCNFARVSNAAVKLFSNDAKYYKHVEKKYLAKTVEDIATAYKTTSDNAGDVMNTAVNGALAIEFGTKGTKLLGTLGDLADVKLDWLKNIEFSYGYALKNSLVGANTELKLNKKKIVSAEMTFEMAENEAYVRIPEVDSSYLLLDEDILGEANSLGDEVDMNSFDKELNAYLKALPSKGTLAKMLNKYIDIALDQVQDVKVGNKKVKVGDIQQNLTTIKVEIDEETLENIIVKVCEELKKDKDVKNTILKFCDALKEYERTESDGEDTYDDFLDMLEDLIDNADRYAKSYGESNGLEYTLYVNGKGEVVGRTVEASTKYSSRTKIETVSYMLVSKGSDYAFEAYSKSDVKRDGKKESSTVNFELSSEGKKKGNKYTGDAEIEIGEGNNKIKYKFSVNKLDYSKIFTGVASGSVKLPLDADALSPIVGSYTASTISSTLGTYLGKDVSVDLGFNSSNKKGDFTITLYSKDEKILSLTMSAKVGKASKLSVPSAKKATEISDEDDLMEWASSLDLSTISKNLEKAGAGDDITDLIDDAQDYLEDMGKFYR
ncbi:MAG: zinc ribbon domain-containing protein [Lachnospiraceae bacterium]|nr:zinc ribbon domain-containing protein [Lachnospiraceae bacterium]